MIITEFTFDTKARQAVLEVKSKEEKIIAILISVDKKKHPIETYYVDGDGSKEVDRSTFNTAFFSFTEKERDAFLKLTSGIYKTLKSEFEIMEQISSKQLAELITQATYGVEGINEDTTLAEAIDFFKCHPDGLFELEGEL
ncbi:hypothetical protein [Latilactobacillus curvatus]